MALQNFLTAQAALLDIENRQKEMLINLLSASPRNRELAALAVKGAPPGAFNTQITTGRFVLEDTSLVSSSFYSSYPITGPDLSDAYAAPTEQQLVFKIDRGVHDQFKVSDLNAETHIMGAGMVSSYLSEKVAGLYKSVEQTVFSQMLASGTFATTGSAGVGTEVSFDASSAANLLESFANIKQMADAQDWSDEDRWLCFPKSVEASMLQFGGADFKDVNYGGSASQPNSAITGKVQSYMGFKLMFNNNATANKGVAFQPDKFGFVIPNGLVIEQVRDKDEWTDFVRVRLRYGCLGLGKAVNAHDGLVLAGQHEGLIRINVA